METMRILSISPFEEDHIAIDRIFAGAANSAPARMTWQLSRARTLPTALTALRQVEYSVILCESAIGQDSWKELLEDMQDAVNSSVLIVTSLHADERLWAEALNLGAYDVIAKPFRPAELIHAAKSACMYWQRRRQSVGHPMHATMAAC